MQVVKKRPAMPGAGRPKGSGAYGEPTKAVRVPLSLLDRIMKIINAYRKAKRKKK